MKARLRTVAEITSVKGNGLCSLQFRVQDHEARTPVGSSFGKEYMTAVIRPARLHGMTRTTCQRPAFTGIEIVLVNLKTTTGGRSEGDFRSINRIPICLRTMRTHVSRNPGKDSGRQGNFVKLRFAPTVRGDDQPPAVRGPTRSGFVALVARNPLGFRLWGRGKPDLRVPGRGKDHCHSRIPGILDRSQVAPPIVRDCGNSSRGKLQMVDIVKDLSVTGEENARPHVIPTRIEGDFFEGGMRLSRSHQ